MSTNNPLTEISLVVVAALLVIGGVVLLFVSKIDIAFASSMFILAAGLLGFNGALKAPSSAQQQSLVNLLATHTHPVPPPPTLLSAQTPGTKDWVMTPAQPPVGQVPLSELKLQSGQTVKAPIPPSPIDPGVSMAAFSTAQMPAVTPPVGQL